MARKEAGLDGRGAWRGKNACLYLMAFLEYPQKEKRKKKLTENRKYDLID